MSKPVGIQPDLSGPSRAKRLAYLEALISDPSADTELVEVLLKIENVPATITDYREKERFLEEFLKIVRAKQPPLDESMSIISLSHLLGTLYINFEKFWSPTLRALTTFMSESRVQNRLIDITIEHLKIVNEYVYHERDDDSSSDDRADHILHRNLIFQVLTKFSHYIESHSNTFMDQLFVFIEKEMLDSPFIEKFTAENLITCDKKNTLQIDGNDPNEDKTASGDNSKMIQLEKRKSKETFVTAVKILHSFRSMKNVHRSDEFKVILLDFLCCRDGNIQRASFNCLIAYEIDQLKPYIPRILKILNDKSVRSELSTFCISANESDQVIPEDRSELIPVLLRILFGKMKGQIGKKSSGREKADQRKTIVMRFVSECSQEEISFFLGLMFDAIFRFVSIPYHELAAQIRDSVDFSNYVPLNRLHAMMASLSTHISSVGHLKDESLEQIFKLISILIYHVTLPLESSSKLSSRATDSLKVLRRSCFGMLIDFFKTFEYYKFKKEELDFVFNHLIWPSTDGFIDRNHATITPLIRLIQIWSENSNFQDLLIIRNKSDPEEYLLKHMIDLYSSTKTSRPMLKFVAKILAALITPEQESADIPEYATINLPILHEDAEIPAYDPSDFRLCEDMPRSHRFLLGSLPRILDRLQSICQMFIDKKDASYRLEGDELLVLSSLSQYMKDPHQAILAARLLLTALDGLKKGDLILETIRTATSLIAQADKFDSTVVSLVSNILGYQRNNDQRQELCNLLAVFGSHSPISQIVEAIKLMNTTFGDTDSPDLVKLNEGFRIIFEYLDTLGDDLMNKSDIVNPALYLLVHQICFIMSNVDKYEFSVRENCSVFFTKLSSKLALVNDEQNSDCSSILIEKILLDKFIKKGFRETNTSVRHAYIGAVRPLAINCHSKSKVLNELYSVCNENKELDFWVNIKHIQLHHRSRALARLLAEGKLYDMSPKTLSSYFMPIAAGFLFSKQYKSLASLIENSIKLIGIICRSLNWVTYESILSYYLGLLTKANATYQRQNIKLISTILKNFNFNLTSCNEAMQYEEENSKLEKRMMKRRKLLSKDVIDAEAPKPSKKLNPSTARMVYFSVTKKIIPQLDSCLNEMTRVELEHDKNMANYLPEKNEIKRIPIAFAIVQLLNLLPGRYVLFRDHLPTLFMKLSSFLKSKNVTVRKTARDTLIKIMNFVGPAYFPDLLRILKEHLLKGFQIHVLTYTVHSVLDQLSLVQGDLDHSVESLLDLSLHEIFGAVSEDKEVKQILAKTPEAKKTKGYDTLMIVSSCISPEKLQDLIKPVKGLLVSSNDSKKVNKLSVCIEKIFTGLASNSKFPLDKLLDFIKHNIEDSLPSLSVKQIVEVASKQTSGLRREDRFLIRNDPPRHRLTSKINKKGNLHMVIDNCLRLLLQTLMSHKAVIKKKELYKTKLDCFVNILSDCLRSTSPRCVMRSLKCICFIAKVIPDSPSFEKMSDSLVKKIFILLDRYNGVGMVQGENLEMIRMCFQALTILLIKCKDSKLDESQTHALLSYIEQDLHDNARQKTAFKALFGILKKRITSPELDDIMTKVADMLVTSNDDTVQSISIKLWQTYLLDYEHDPKALQDRLTKFLRQLDYEFVEGRKSVLGILNVVVNKFPEKLLLEHYELLFHLFAQRVVNEESKEVRAKVARLISTMVQRLPAQRNFLFNKFVMPWASAAKPELKLLGLKLISIFIEADESIIRSDRSKLKRILTAVDGALSKSEGRLADPESKPDDDTQPVTAAVEVRLVSVEDKLNYHSLRLFKRTIDRDLMKVTDSKYLDQLKSIWWKIIEDLLTNWYQPVVLTSCQLVLSFLKKSGIQDSLSSDVETDPFLKQSGKRIIRTLIDKFINLLDRADELDFLMDYIMESMILLGKSVARSKSTIKFEDQYLKSFDGCDVVDHILNMDKIPNSGFVNEHLPYSVMESKRKLNLMWLSVKVVMQARKEVALFRLKRNFRRNFVLRWTASISQELGIRRVLPYVILYLMTPIRELTDKGKTKDGDHRETLSLSEDFLKYIKGLVGIEKFNKIYSKVQLYYTKRRVNRKKNEALIKVKDQARGVKRKLKMRQDKRKLKR